VRGLVLVLVLALVSVPALAAEAPPPPAPPTAGRVYLSWVRLAGAESCPDVRQLADDVSRRLGWNPFRESPTQFIEAQIRRDPPGERAEGTWFAEVFLRDANGASHGNRVFSSNAPTCTSLSSVVALSIAIIIDPDVMLRRFSDSADDSGPPAAERAAAPPPGPSVAGAGGAVVAFAGAGLRLLPQAGVAAGLAGEVALPARLAARAGFMFLPEVRTVEPDPNFAFGLTAAWLGACFDVIRRDVVSLGGCAAGMGGAIHAVVYFPDATRPGQRTFWAATGGLRLALRLSARVEAQLAADGVVPLNRREFTIAGRSAGMNVAFTQPAAAALLWVGLGVRFR
jgi:hypothetical protein